MVRSRGEKREFGGGLWQVRLLAKVRFVVSGLERTAGRAAHCGSREVSRVPGVRVLVGGHTAVADIAVEYRRTLKVLSSLGSALHISAQAKFRPVARTPTERNDGAREDSIQNSRRNSRKRFPFNIQS